MAGNEIRPLTKIVSTAGTGYRYYTGRTDATTGASGTAPLRPVVRRHVDFREER
ncbi:50S ribosomal protein L33 [Rhodococcus hoagii]|nr:50S ribosomal protein L33 [Prescottella equi]